MGNRNRHAVIGLLLVATACGGGGGGGGGGSNTGNNRGSAFGTVNLLSHSPADNAIQVDLDVVLMLEFDALMATDTLADEDTWLRKAGSEINVPLTFTRDPGGRIACKPESNLQPETVYVFQISALSSDVSGRILDVTSSFHFRTYDAAPPTIAAFSIADGTTGVSRTGEFTLSFNEAIDQASISEQTLYLRDDFGSRYPLEAKAIDETVSLTPQADLPGDREYLLVATASLSDRVGNLIGTRFESSFRTAIDTQQPSVTSCWPALNATNISPKVQPVFTFDESMDPATVEAVSLSFQDQYGNIVPFIIDPTIDQRRLHVRPLTALNPHYTYTLELSLGTAAATDVSGNSLMAAQALSFTTGTDNTPPAVISSSPGPGQNGVPGILVANVAFDENLDSEWVNATTVELSVAGQSWDSVVELSDPNSIQITPIMALPKATTCTLTLVGGQTGLRDLAGNAQTVDTTISFTTSDDTQLPDAIILPPDGAVSVATGSCMSIFFDAPMDAATLTPTTVIFTDDLHIPLSGQMELSADNRVVTFTPTNSLLPDSIYRVRIVSGSTGVRRISGNWLESDRTTRFRTGFLEDHVVPEITVSINGIPSSRRDGIVLPPSGFTVEVITTDVGGQWADMGAVEVELAGGSGPSAEILLTTAVVEEKSLQVKVPWDTPLSAGSWTLRVRAPDMSGNMGHSTTIYFEVDTTSVNALPFERTQVVWVRTDLDRDDNGTSDFSDDMLRLGFATAGDPINTNTWLEGIVRDGILAKANHLYRRGQRGEPIDDGSVQLRFSNREPILLPHMQIALGGLDPEGDQTRTFGDESTGVLGRAYYDYRNSNTADRNTKTSPGLGVFPAEMWLYQVSIHNQVYPSWQTIFARKFLPICPGMGGTPAGSHPLDAAVLTPTFDYDTATGSERARWISVMSAADDWVAAMGIILAHEVGHSVGLVAPGPMPTGLFGSSNLHNTYASAAEVMAAAVGYEAMTTLDYQFRDIDLAYLRQRVLLR